jgi:RecB family exonuclease
MTCTWSPRWKPPTSDDRIRLLRHNLAASADLIKGINAEFELQVAAAERIKAEAALTRFVNWQEANHDTDVVGVEVPFEVRVEIDGTPVQLVGTVDRLERTGDGRLRVVDFKTNKRPPTASATAAHEQLGVYQLAVDAGGFDRVAGQGSVSAGGSLVYLRLAAGNDLEDYPREFHQAALTERPSLDEHDAAHPTWVHERLSRAVTLLREGRFPATPGDGCTWCPFTTSCPAKPPGRQVVA